jgi:Ca2+-binding EF-hand superfamily protein
MKANLVATACLVSGLWMGAIGATGCGRAPQSPVAKGPAANSPAAKPAQAKAAAVKPAEVKPAEEKPAATPAQPTDDPVEPAAPEATQSAAAAAPANAAAPAAVAQPVIPTERMLLLAPQGPLVVEFELWVDGQSQATAFDGLLSEVLKIADTDGDGRPTWAEVTTSPKFRYGQFGNLPIERDNAPKQIIRQYDLNGNGNVDRDELPRFLTRNAGGARPFSVRSIEQFHRRNRHGSPTWRVLDVDDDGQLSPQEWSTAARELRRHDENDDETLVIDELRRTIDLDQAMNNRTRGVKADFAVLLGDHASWDSVRASLEEVYASRGNLDQEDFRQMGHVFAKLDADGDGKLLRKEFPGINQLPANLRIRVDFGVAAGNGPQPVIRLLHADLPPLAGEGAALQTQELADRLILRWGGVTLTFVRNDLVAAVDYEAQAKQQVMQFDTNANGYLEAEELNEQAQQIVGRLEALDTDDDKQVYPGEVATYLRQRQGAQRVQVHVRAQDQEDLLFEALDHNADGRLDAQELEQLAERLRRLDASGDGQLTSDELPEGIAVAIGRGGVDNPNQLFAIRAAEITPPMTDAPAWFRAMDTSGDGVISRREFLGSPEKFAQLDQNQNGFFEASEIPTELKTPEDTTTAEKPTEEQPVP